MVARATAVARCPSVPQINSVQHSTGRDHQRAAELLVIGGVLVAKIRGQHDGVPVAMNQPPDGTAANRLGRLEVRSRRPVRRAPAGVEPLDHYELDVHRPYPRRRERGRFFRGVCARAEAAARFSVLVLLGSRSTLDAALAARDDVTLPLAMVQV